MQQKELVGKVQTVLGIIDSNHLGISLVHEHLLVDVTQHFTEPTAASEKKLAHEPVCLENLWWVRLNQKKNIDNLSHTDEQLSTKEVMLYKLAGGNTITEVTCDDLSGRDPLGLARISRMTGLNIIMGTGYYLASAHPQLATKPEHEITEEFVNDIMVGVGNTGIRAGIIGEVVCSTMDNNERKVLRCCAAAQRKTGISMYIHPSPSDDSVLENIRVLADAGADLSHVIIGHVDHFHFNSSTCRRIIDAGCYIAYDNFGTEGSFLRSNPQRIVAESDIHRINDIIGLIGDGFLSKILISQDIATKVGLVSYGGFGYGHILRSIVPMMRIRGLSEEQIHTLLVDNPKRVLPFVTAKE